MSTSGSGSSVVGALVVGAAVGASVVVIGANVVGARVVVVVGARVGASVVVGDAVVVVVVGARVVVGAAVVVVIVGARVVVVVGATVVGATTTGATGRYPVSIPHMLTPLLILNEPLIPQLADHELIAIQNGVPYPSSPQPTRYTLPTINYKMEHLRMTTCKFTSSV
jgi:hypothetical protein